MEIKLTIFFVLTFLALRSFAQVNYTPYTFTTFAGNTGKFPGSADGTGNAALFYYPTGVAVDTNGTVYLADDGNRTIRKITSVGVVTTLAGQVGVSGTNDGTGSAARFYNTGGVAVDNSGNVFVADGGNDTIRKLTLVGTNWVVTTLAGLAGISGTSDGTGSAARFNGPSGVALDSAGNVYVADTWNFTIRKLSSAGVVTTLAGRAGFSGGADGTNNMARFSYPNGVAVDSTGNIYVVDSGNTIRKVTPVGTNWVVKTLAGLAGVSGTNDGMGSAARFWNPFGVAVDSAGNLYVVDSDNSTIRKVTPAGVVTTLGGMAGSYSYADGTGSAARFYIPFGVTVDSAGNVYVTDSNNNTIRKGWPASSGVGVTIIKPPQSTNVPAGANATFNVTAIGTGLLFYQWQFNGQNIPNATNATLTLNSVGAGNSGGYSVVVWNAYGSATSAAASLAVLTDGSNGNKPVPITATPVSSKPSGATKLVFVTHGWEPGLTEPDSPQWVSDMCSDIQTKVSSDWQVVPYFWIDSAWTLEPQKALDNAQSIGTQLGKQIASMGFQQVHLIAHSAGSGMIQAIADQLKSSPNPPQIQMTFLDPYLGIFLQEQNNYGKNADWSDCYFVEDGSGGFTGSYLNHAFNVDVSWVDPAHTAAPYIGLGGGEVALSSHGYPFNFYIGSITGGNSSCSSAYGFPLSQEMEGVFWFNNQANDPVGSGPFLPCSPPDAVKNPNPGIAGLESGIAGIPFDISSAAYALSDLGSSLVGNAGFVLNSIWSALPHVKPGGIQPMDNTYTNTPAWLAVGVSVTNAVNFVQFDAGFMDTNTAQGLLTVYWNTNQIGMVYERVAPTNSQTYRFELPGTVSSGLYTLSFRLDSFNNSSSIAVTNVATGFVGMTQPITLGISLMSGAPLLQLTAATNFTYLIQSSTNLLDWTPTALLLNTNGTAQFTDSAVTNSSTRFYRAVMP